MKISSEIIGQVRAISAARFGIGMRHHGLANGVKLRLLVPANSGEDFFHLLEKARIFFENAGLIMPSCKRITSAGIGELVKAIRQTGASVLVLNGDGSLRSSEGFSTILNEVDCPVVMVG